MGPGISPTNNRRTPVQRHTVLKAKNKKDTEKTEKTKDQTQKDQRSVTSNKLAGTEKAVGRLDTSVFEAFEPAHRSSIDQSKSDICGGAPGLKCGLIVGCDDEGVECDLCLRWYHAHCQEIPSEAYKALQEHLEVLAWICKGCRNKMKQDEYTKRSDHKLEAKIDALADIIKDQMKVIRKTGEENEQAIRELGEFQGRNICALQEQNEATIGCVERMASSLSSVQEQNKSLVNQIKTMRENGSGEPMEAEKSYAEVAKTACERIMTTIGAKLDAIPKVGQLAEDIKKVIKSKNMEDRAENILIHNVPESTAEKGDKRREDDLKKLKVITEALGLTEVEVKSIVRLGRKMGRPETTSTEENSQGEQQKQDAKPRIMLIKLSSKDQVETMYKRRFDLKSKGIENTYITKDLDPEERAKQRKLREEWHQKGRETHVIYRGRVVERKGNRQTK